jgi:hypothetical protein
VGQLLSALRADPSDQPHAVVPLQTQFWRALPSPAPGSTPTPVRS